MPYLYEDGNAEAWQTLMESLVPMGYSVEDEEQLELNSSLASEVRTLMITSFNLLLTRLCPLIKYGKDLSKITWIFSF